MNSMDERGVRNVCYRCDNGAREISVVSSSHLLHVRHLLEMTDTNAFVLGAITCV